MVVALCVFLLHRFLGGVGAVCARQDPRKKKKEGLLPRSSIAVNRNVITQRRFPFFFPSSSSSSAPPTVSCQTHGERKYILYARSCIPIRYVTHSSLMEGASKLFSFFFSSVQFFLSFFLSLFGGFTSALQMAPCAGWH